MIQTERETRSAQVADMVDEMLSLLEKVKAIVKGTGHDTERQARKAIDHVELALNSDCRPHTLESIAELLLSPDDDEPFETGPEQCPICGVVTGDGRLCTDCVRNGYDGTNHISETPFVLKTLHAGSVATRMSINEAAKELRCTTYNTIANATKALMGKAGVRTADATYQLMNAGKP